MSEQTVILIKPDGMRKGLIGKIISRFEKAGFKMVGAKLIKLNQLLLDKWYAHHKDKDFFPFLCQFMMETPVLAMVWQGGGVVSKVREICGATDPAKALPGTIRAKFGGPTVMENIIHASDSPETAEREKNLIFKPEEIFEGQT